MSMVERDREAEHEEREQVRQVILATARPRPPRVPVADAVDQPPMSWGTVGLIILVVLLVLLSLGALGAEAAGGAGGAAGTVKKGSGGPRQIQITPSEKLEIISPLAALTPHNFPQNFSDHAPILNVPEPLSPKNPADLVIILGVVLGALFWVDSRLGRPRA